MTDFPCLVESHLSGYEFSCEAFIHGGKIQFLNLTEYVKLGYSNFIPAGRELESKRSLIEREVQKLVNIFGFKYGMIHPEWFINDAGELNFGEVACRIPGGHILELASQAYGFDALLAFVLCHDPSMSQEELDALFAPTRNFPQKYYGNVMIFPQQGQISKLVIPESLRNEPYYLDNNLIEPLQPMKIGGREGFGNHFGTVNFVGEDPARIRTLLKEYQDVQFYL